MSVSFRETGSSSAPSGSTTQQQQLKQQQQQPQQQPQQQQQSFIPQPPRLFPAGFVHLSGGIDTNGCHVACFPPRSIIRMHLNNVGIPELVGLIHYCQMLASEDQQQRSRGLAFLADFRACSQSIFRLIIDSLETVQKQSPGSVAVFYVLLPRSKELAKSLQKLLGLYEKRSLILTKKSAPNPNAKSFRSVILPTLQELHQFVTKSNLMMDFSGTLNYDHEAWMKLRAAFEGLLIEVGSIAEKIPAALDNLEHLKNFSNPQDDEDCQDVAHSMQDRFQAVTAGLGIDAASERVSQLREACRQPERHPDTMQLSGNPLLKFYEDRLQRLEDKLEEMRLALRQKWKEAETDLLLGSQMDLHRRSATLLADWLDRAVLSAKRIDTKAIANQQMAEDAKEKFRMQVLEPSAPKLTECRSMVTKLKQLAAASAGESPNDAAKLAENLEAKLKNFNDTAKVIGAQLDKIQAFFFNASHVLPWYTKCMLRLIFDLVLPDQQGLQASDPVPISARWSEAAKSFRVRHPCPLKAQLDDMRDALPLIEHIEIRQEANLLLHRVGILCRLLDETRGEVVRIGEFRDLVDWRDRDTMPEDIAAEFPNLQDTTQSIAESSIGEASPKLPPQYSRPLAATAASSFPFPADHDGGGSVAANSDQQRRYRRRLNDRSPRASSSRSGTEVVEVIPEPIIIDHRRMTMAKPPRRYIEDDEDVWSSHRAAPVVESQPKEETVRRFLENMVTPPLDDSVLSTPSVAAAKPDSQSERVPSNSSRVGRSLTDLVSDLKDIGDEMFSGRTASVKQQQPPVAARLGRRVNQPVPSQQAQFNEPLSVMERSQSEQDLSLLGNQGYRRHLFLLQLDNPHSATGASQPAVVAYPIEMVNINQIIGDIRDISSDRHQPARPHNYDPLGRIRSSNRGYSMSQMSDTDPVSARDYKAAGDDEITGRLRPSRYSENFLFNNANPTAVSRSGGSGGAGGGLRSPRPLLSPQPPPSISEERFAGMGTPGDSGGSLGNYRWGRRDNRIWHQFNSRYT